MSITKVGQSFSKSYAKKIVLGRKVCSKCKKTINIMRYDELVDECPFCGSKDLQSLKLDSEIKCK